MSCHGLVDLSAKQAALNRRDDAASQRWIPESLGESWFTVCSTRLWLSSSCGLTLLLHARQIKTSTMNNLQILFSTTLSRMINNVNGNRSGRGSKVNQFLSIWTCSWSSALSFSSASYRTSSVLTNSSSRMNQIVFVPSTGLWLQFTIKGSVDLHLIRTWQSDMCVSTRHCAVLLSELHLQGHYNQRYTVC